MKLLFVGDIFGSAGRIATLELLPRLREEHEIDCVLVNGENAARGIGINLKNARDLLAGPVDGITLGNHAFRQSDIFPFLNTDKRIVRPANMPRKSPGRGMMFISCHDFEIAVINIMGSLFLDVAASPFEVIDDLVEKAAQRARVIVVDMHAEATSEKVAMGRYLMGRVSAVVGTHTHVQTSDARILGGHTAYITDLGMTGPHDSVIGVDADIILKKLTTGIGARFHPAVGGVQLEGVVIDIDEATGVARGITAIRVPYNAE